MGAIFDQKSGKLYWYSYRTTEVWSPWPKPMAWRKSASDAAWRRLRPTLKLPKCNVDRKIQRILESESRRPYRVQASNKDLAAEKAVGVKLHSLQWIQRIPDEVRKAVAVFPSRQWHLLSMAARCGDGALDLIQSNRALAFMMASNWVYHTPAVTQPLRSVRALLRPGKRHRDMLVWLGFPDRRAARKVLAKVIPKSINVAQLFYLRQACHDPRMLKVMGHLPRLNAGCLRIVTDPDLIDIGSYSLLEEISADRREDAGPRSAGVLRDVLRMLEALGGRVASVRHIRRVSDLKEWHDHLAARVPVAPSNAGRSEDVMRLPFPREPIPGTDMIVPIRDPESLRAEATEQQHCAWAMASDVAMKQDIYFYRVMSPERATLALVLRSGRWRLKELRGYKNESVHSGTRALVERWLSEHQGQAPDSWQQRPDPPTHANP